MLRLIGGAVNLTGRDHLTLWRSDDGGGSYRAAALVDAGAAGYSSLQLVSPAPPPTATATAAEIPPGAPAARKARPAAGAREGDEGDEGDDGDGGGDVCDLVYLLYEQADPGAVTPSALTADAFIGGLPPPYNTRLILPATRSC